MPVPARAALLPALLLAAPLTLPAQEAGPQARELVDRAPPVRQSDLDRETAGPPEALTLRDAARDDRWIGAPVRDVRWAPDGEHVYFRWHPEPEAGQDPDADPWLRVDRAGDRVEELAADELDEVPGSELSWSADGRYAAWTRDGALYLHDARADGDRRVRLLHAGAEGAGDARVRRDGSAVDFMVGEDLHRYDLATGSVRRLTRKHEAEAAEREIAEWLEEEQPRLLEHIREAEAREDSAEARERRRPPVAAQPLPVARGAGIEDVRVSPDGRHVVYVERRPASDREATEYMDYVTESGHAAALRARPKVGEPQDAYRIGVVAHDPTVDEDDVEPTWVEIPGAGDRRLVLHPPVWNPSGDRAVIRAVSGDHEDLWIAVLDPATGDVTVVTRDRDEAWLGGPPIQPNYFQPGLLEWIDDDRFVFASERTGWSHLYVADAAGAVAGGGEPREVEVAEGRRAWDAPGADVRALTSGPWEVRGAELTRDRSTWILQASRRHPAEDHLYRMPADGGELERLTEKPGRSEARVSPDGGRLAVIHSNNTSMPDLFLRDPEPGADETRITVSGTDAFWRHGWVTPEIVSFEHPDGDPVWAALYRPEEPLPERAAVMHVHGGGYRQFAHRGWTVYGYALHLGFLHWLVERGYTVIDFDYRGGAGFGRDYRTDIYKSMGQKDVDGAAAAVEWLAENESVDPSRVGIYGVSYGGFMTLMSLFRHPGAFAAGIARGSVTDWSHYNHTWTSRILGLPQDDPEAYRLSSPIYHAEGLEDALLLMHGVVDDNVHFQDDVRLVQRLIELEKDFEVMYYPKEPHTIQTERSRYDYVKRSAEFFRVHLLRR